MNITTLFISLFTNRPKSNHPQGHRKGKGYHCSRLRHYNTDNDKTVWYRWQQCQKTSHHPNWGQYFHCSESHPSSLLSGCDNPRLAAPASSAASSVPCHPSSPACSANTGYSLPDWDIYTHNSQEATCDKHHLGDHGRETPQQRSNQHQSADTSTSKCRLDHSRCAAAHGHHWATEAPLLADPVLHGPKRVVRSSPVTCCDMHTQRKSTGKKKCQATVLQLSTVSEKFMGNGDGGCVSCRESYCHNMSPGRQEQG